MPKAFISYSSQDPEIGERLRNSLRAFGDEVFFAGDSIPPGVDFWAYITVRLQESDVVIVAASANSVKSDSVLREVNEALRLKKKIIPLLCGIRPADLPDSIRHLQAMDIDKPEELNRFLASYGKEVSQGNFGLGMLIGGILTGIVVWSLMRKSSK